MSHQRFPFALLLLLSSCGGGSDSDSSEIPNFRGIWDLTTQTSKNDCDPSLIGQTSRAVYSIRQNGKEILISVQDGTSIKGTVNGSDSFTAAQSSSLGDCTIQAEVTFSDLQENTATVQAKGQLSCQNTETCTFETAPGQAQRRP